MVDAPKKSAGKKHGPFTTVGWVGLGGGTLVLFYLYKRYTAASAATTAANNALAGGTSIPSGSVSTTLPASGLPTFSSLAAWIQAALSSNLTGSSYSSTQLYNDINAWVNGNCVSQAGYNAIGQLLTSQGLPPGYGGGAPALSVCASASAAPAPAAAAPAPTAPTAPAAQYFQLGSLQSLLDLIGAGGTAYQSGAEANAWDAANGATPNADPNAFYALSPAAAQALAAKGQATYQDTADINLWNQLHPNG